MTSWLVAWDTHFKFFPTTDNHISHVHFSGRSTASQHCDLATWKTFMSVLIRGKENHFLSYIHSFCCFKEPKTLVDENIAPNKMVGFGIHPNPSKDFHCTILCDMTSSSLVGFSILLSPSDISNIYGYPTQECQRLGRGNVLLNPSNNSQRKIQTIVVVFPRGRSTQGRSISTWNSCSHLDSRPCRSLTPLNQVRPETCTRSS